MIKDVLLDVNYYSFINSLSLGKNAFPSHRVPDLDNRVY